MYRYKSILLCLQADKSKRVLDIPYSALVLPLRQKNERKKISVYLGDAAFSALEFR